MSIITSFGELYDKTLAPGFANYTTSNDAFEVKEHDPKASTTLLRVEQAGAIFASFNYMLVKGMKENGIYAYHTPTFEDAEKFIRENIHDKDVVITLGCGNIYQLNDMLKEPDDN